MLKKSPSGALSPYYYKGGYFHGIHYGSYFDDMDSLRKTMQKEEEFILCSPDKRRIMIDLYETNLTQIMYSEVAEHLERISHKSVKIAIAGEKRCLRLLHKYLKRSNVLTGRLFFSVDMEEGKTWLVSDR